VVVQFFKNGLHLRFVEGLVDHGQLPRRGFQLARRRAVRPTAQNRYAPAEARAGQPPFHDLLQRG
jgi:hypothetical protein